MASKYRTLAGQQTVSKGSLPTFVLLTAGLLLLGMSASGFFPTRTIAGWASPDGNLSREYALLFTQSQWTMALALLAASLLGWAGLRLYNLVRRLVLRPSDLSFLLLCGLIAFGLALAAQFILFDNMPHVTDAISHIFQAKILVSGHVYADAPPCPEAFFQPHVIITTSGKWFSKYTPGHPLLLALALKGSVLWAVVPLCSGVAAALISLLGTRFYGPLTGRTTGLLFSLSPLAILLGGSFMSHTSFLALGLAGAFFIVRAVTTSHRRRPFWGYGLAAGFFLGWSAITRPHEFAMLAIMLAMALIAARVPILVLMRLAIPVALGALPHAAIQAWWNMTLYGCALVIGYGFTSTDLVRPMYQGQFGFSETFGVPQAARILMWTMARFNTALLGWPASLLFVPLAFCHRRIDRRDLVCLLGILVVVAVYFFYDYYGMEFEARYYYLAAPLFIVLVVRGLRRCGSWISRMTSQPRDNGYAVVLLLVTALSLHGLAFYWPARIEPTYARDYEQASPVMHRLAQQHELSNALVLVPSEDDDSFRYSGGFAFMSPVLDSEVLYARDIGPLHACLEKAFPGRTIYRFVPNDNWTSGRFDPLKIAGEESDRL